MAFEDRGFGRRHAPDTRDFNYPMRAVLRAAPVPTRRYYNAGRVLPLDQGQTGTCVAHAWHGFLLAALMMTKHPPNVFDMYRGFVLLDEWKDNDAEATATDISALQGGTSVRAGAKWLQDKGHLKSYLWTRNADEAATWLLTGHGTLVFGTTWYWGMSDLDKQEYGHLEGGVAGGHSYLCIGYDRTRKAFRFVNSWGKNFGTNGRFWLKHDDVQTLIEDDGEVCAAVEQFVPPLA